MDIEKKYFGGASVLATILLKQFQTRPGFEATFRHLRTQTYIY